MIYYITITVNNGRQYNFQIPENGIEVTSNLCTFCVNQQEPNMNKFLELFDSYSSFNINNVAIFNPNNISAIQYQTANTEN